MHQPIHHPIATTGPLAGVAARDEVLFVAIIALLITRLANRYILAGETVTTEGEAAIVGARVFVVVVAVVAGLVIGIVLGNPSEDDPVAATGDGRVTTTGITG